MEAIGVVINIILFILAIYLLSRVAEFINQTKKKLNEMDKKLEDIKKHIAQKE